MNEADFVTALALGAMGGLLLGRIWAGWAIWGYLQSKTPDAAGWRTGFFMRGKFYYVVSAREYVDRVMCATDGAEPAPPKVRHP